MVPAVGLLSTLLHEASTRRPTEVVIATDLPVRVQLPGGESAVIGGPIEGTALSDELSELLGTEQQVDLALGEPVKFDLVVGAYVWHLVGETAAQVVSVRARPSSELLEPGDSVQIPIEPEPDEVQDIPRIRRVPASGPSEIDIDINFDDEAAQLHEEPRPAAGLRLAALKPVPADSKPQPAWPRQVPARPGEHAPAWPREGRGRRSGAQPAAAVATQQLPLQTPRPGDHAGVLDELSAGTLGLLLRAPEQGPAPAEALLQALELPLLVIGEGEPVERVNARLPELAGGGAVLLRVEDPSAWLGWLLRRVEEGHRVLVETGATSPAGARRILLGVAATERAEAWLEAVRVVHAALEGGRWKLL
jgi:hypothetical protein